jgi:hypothetical protein
MVTGDQIEENGMGGTCSSNFRKQKAYTVVKKPEGKDQLTGPCEHINDPSCYRRWGFF